MHDNLRFGKVVDIKAVNFGNPAAVAITIELLCPSLYFTYCFNALKPVATAWQLNMNAVANASRICH